MHSAPTAYVPAPMAFAAVPVAAAAPRAAVMPEPHLVRRTLVKTRAARVCWLIFAIAVLSIADLHMTLVHLTSIGMSEGNPIARLVMSTNSPGMLIAWKMTSVGAACLAFYAGRKKLVGEVAAWFCCAVLVWLTLRWGEYSTELASVFPQVHLLHSADTAQWVKMSP
jgi:hypothetical protein